MSVSAWGDLTLQVPATGSEAAVASLASKTSVPPMRTPPVHSQSTLRLPSVTLYVLLTSAVRSPLPPQPPPYQNFT